MCHSNTILFYECFSKFEKKLGPFYSHPFAYSIAEADAHHLIRSNITQSKDSKSTITSSHYKSYTYIKHISAVDYADAGACNHWIKSCYKHTNTHSRPIRSVSTKEFFVGAVVFCAAADTRRFRLWWCYRTVHALFLHFSAFRTIKRSYTHTRESKRARTTKLH